VTVSRVYEGEAAESRLQELGVPGSEVLVDAIGYGAAAARSVTAKHPVSYRGLRLWAEATAYLRFELKHPWQPETILGVDLVVEQQRGIGIIVTKGDGATGNRSYAPQVVYERGEVIQRLINGSLDTLFTVGERPRWEVWFLLHHLARESCPAELSRPLSIDPRGWVTGWHERILLPAADPFARRVAEVPVPGQGGPEIDVPVTRRVV
jgi:hypothetical protein